MTIIKPTYQFSLLTLLVFFPIFVFGQECIDISINDSNGNEDVYFNCDNGLDDHTINLEVEYTNIPSTDEYTVQSINYSPVINYNEGIALSSEFNNNNGNVIDDKFSNAINIGFPFCFYNEKYTQLVVGSNGILSFNLENANAICPAGIPSANPSPSLVTNSIFGVQNDLIFDNDESEIYYTTIGTAPCRKFIINFYKAKLIGCDLDTTFQVVLHETSNQIDIIIEDKPENCHSGSSGLSLVGILNDFGDNGISPPNRNTGNWDTTSEAWSFTPSGNIPPLISWFNSDGDFLEYGTQIQVTPTENTVYRAEVQYASCNNHNFVFSDNITVEFDSHLPVIENETIYICDNNGDSEELITFSNYNEQVVYTPTANFSIAYYNTLNDAENQQNEITNYNITQESSFFVRVENNSNNLCYIIKEINFVFASTLIQGVDFQICDHNNDGIEEDINIQQTLEGILSELNIDNFQVFMSESDAENSNNPITNTDISQNSEFWLNIPFNNECSVIQGPIIFNFIPSPVLSTIPTITYFGCDINSNHYENFDWQAAIADLITIPNGVLIEAYTTEDNAINQISPLNKIRDNFTEVYIRATNENGCYSIYPVNVEVDFSGMVIRNYQDRICFDGTEDITVNLDDYYLNMINEYDGDFTYAYFQTSSNAQNNVNPISNIQTITEDGSILFSDYYVRFETSEQCFSVKRLRIYLIHPEPLTNEITICDYNSQNVLLSTFHNTLVGNIASTLTYFESLSNAQNDSNPITNYSFVAENTTLYVKIVQFGCVDIHPINFHLTEAQQLTENIILNIEEACITESSQLVDLTSYYTDIYSGQLSPNIIFYTGYNSTEGTLYGLINNPSAYNVNTGLELYALLDFNGESCNVIVSITLEFTPHTSLTFGESNLYTCDFEQDLNETFHLEDGIEQLLTPFPNFNLALYEITYYNSLENAENKESPLLVDFIPNQSEYNIYVRFENTQSGCFDIGTIVLNTIGSPKIFEGNYTSCDLNANGVNDIVLEDLIPIVSPTHDNFTFSYHLSEDDAINNQNGITDNIYENTSSLTSIWVRAENFSDCYGVTNVNIIEGTPLSLSQNEFTLNACDFDLDGFASFDLSEIISQLNLTNETFHFFTTQDDIMNNSPINDYTSYTNIETGGETIYLKVISSDSHCPGFATIHLVLNTPPLVNLDNIEFCQTDNFIISPEIVNTSIDYNFEWYNDNNELISTDLELQGNYPQGTYTFIIIPTEIPACFGTYNVEVTINSIQTANQTFTLEACDLNGNGIQTFNLNDVQPQLNTDQNIQGFYSTNNLNTTISTPDSFDNSTPYNQSVFVLIEESNSCPKFYELNLQINQLTTANQTFTLQACDLNGNGIQTFNLNDVQSQLNTNQNIQGFYSTNDLNASITTPDSFDNSTPYNQSVFVLIEESNSCPKFYEINLQIDQLTTANQTFTLQACDLNGNGIQTFNLNDVQSQLNTGQNIQGFYSTNDLSTSISTPDSFDNSTPYNQSVFVLIEESNSCPKFYEIQLTIDLIASSNQTANLIQCNANGTGIVSFDLTEVQSQLPPNQTIISFHTDDSLQTTITTPTAFNNNTPYQDVVYALITEQGNCPKAMPIHLEVLPDPIINIDETRICSDGSNEIFAEISNPNSHYQFEWLYNNMVISNSLNSGEIFETGTYILNVTTDIDNTCSYSFETEVTLLDTPIILDLVFEGTTVKVIASGSNPMEYTMDNNSWQLSNVFNSIPNGPHQFFVRYRDLGCISNAKGSYIVGMHNVLTPNNDGINDELRFPNLSIYNGEKVDLKIFDRNGKLVFETKSDSEIVWNGKINNQPLPTGDYWYFLNFPDGQKFSGHITIKNK